MLWETSRRFVRNALQRGRDPRVFIENDRTPHVELLREGMFALRHYPPLVDGPSDSSANGSERHPVPLLLVPPLGLHTFIFDLPRERSFVRYFLARGFDVYLIDWGAPGVDDHQLSLDHYVNRWLPAARARVAEHSGCREISMLGYCLGGLLGLIAAANDDTVRNVVAIASPIDFHSRVSIGHALGADHDLARAARVWGQRAVTQIDPRRFHMPGWVMAWLFQSTNFSSSVRAYFTMLANLDDTEHLIRHTSMGQWFNDMPYYPGGVVRDIAEKFKLDNALARGRLAIGGVEIDFARVHSALLAVAGERDRLGDIESVRCMLDIVSSSDKTFHIAPGGHAGVFAGRAAPTRVWQPIAEWLAARSRAATAISTAT